MNGTSPFASICVASLLSVLLTVNGARYLVPLRAGVITGLRMRKDVVILNLYTIRGKMSHEC